MTAKQITEVSLNLVLRRNLDEMDGDENGSPGQVMGEEGMAVGDMEMDG